MPLFRVDYDFHENKTGPPIQKSVEVSSANDLSAANAIRDTIRAEGHSCSISNVSPIKKESTKEAFQLAGPDSHHQ